MSFTDDVRRVWPRACAPIVAAYRRALSTAAGVPEDPAWTALVDALDALLAKAVAAPEPGAQAAAARLRRFVAENRDALEG